MNGNRVYPKPSEDWVFNLKAGEYGCAVDGKSWYCKTPNNYLGSLSAHQITEHEDGTITVSPSILVSHREGNEDKHGWHGFLERGVWRRC